MSALKDLTGQRFRMLTVTGRAGCDPTGKTTWHCACDCGGASVVTGLNLRSGNSKSCGCRQHRKGLDNPRTITDPTRIQMKKRRVLKYREWRQTVMQADGRCVQCGSKEGLQAHHILGFSAAPHLRIDPRNGVTLCGPCHRAFHAKYGNDGFSEEDLCEWLVGIRERPPIISTDTVLEGEMARIARLAMGGLEDLKKARHYLDKLIEVSDA